MKERPILFNAEMVRAILDGRKTQTRRVIKPQPTHTMGGAPLVRELKGGELHLRALANLPCPMGDVGDRLWVRETFQPYWKEATKLSECDWKTGRGYGISYPATHGVIEIFEEDGRGITTACKPSIHMPRWASRITLEITNVRFERLRDISNDDILAEGAGHPIGTPLAWGSVTELWNRERFLTLWESTGGDWKSNPWVWVIEFKKMAGA